MKEKTERGKMTQSEEYQLMLKNQIKQAGEWLIDNSERIVADIKWITDFKIHINLQNGDTLPTIRIEQENGFFDYNDFADQLKKYEIDEEIERIWRDE